METESRAVVYAAALEIEQTDSNHLVTFGGKDDRYRYSDGLLVESHFSFNKALWKLIGMPTKIILAFSSDNQFIKRRHEAGLAPPTILDVIEPDADPDPEFWYRIQSNYVWYYVRACCRSCATRRLNAWVDPLGELKTQAWPDWLIKVSA